MPSLHPAVAGAGRAGAAAGDVPGSVLRPRPAPPPRPARPRHGRGGRGSVCPGRHQGSARARGHDVEWTGGVTYTVVFPRHEVTHHIAGPLQTVLLPRRRHPRHAAVLPGRAR